MYYHRQEILTKYYFQDLEEIVFVTGKRTGDFFFSMNERFIDIIASQFYEIILLF